MKKFLILVMMVAVVAASLFGGCAVNGRDGRDGKDAQDVSIQEIYEAAKAIEGNENLTFDQFLKEYLSYNDDTVGLKSVINRSLMSGVSILSRFAYSDGSGYLSGMRRSYKVYTGSGAILWLDKSAGDAYVVTNCHVVYDDSSVSAFCQDIRLYLYGQDEKGTNFSIDLNNDIVNDENYRIEAEIIGASVSYDIALLKVTGSDVLKRSDAVAARFSQSSEVYAGEYVYAIGNAESEGMSASNGIVSRESEYIELNMSDIDENAYTEYRVMRITAPINHGNSGGALYNTRGEIIGIVNAKLEGEDIDNMGYALPANYVKRLLKLMYDSYASDGNSSGVRKAFLNIATSVSDSYSRYNESMGVAEIFDTVRVESISGAPARANLQNGDIFKSVKITDSQGTVKEDIKVTRRYHVQDVMFSVRLGDTVTMTVERGGQNVDVAIVFDSENYFRNYY